MNLRSSRKAKQSTPSGAQYNEPGSSTAMKPNQSTKSELSKSDIAQLDQLHLSTNPNAPNKRTEPVKLTQFTEAELSKVNAAQLDELNKLGQLHSSNIRNDSLSVIAQAPTVVRPGDETPVPHQYYSVFTGSGCDIDFGYTPQIIAFVNRQRELIEDPRTSAEQRNASIQTLYQIAVQENSQLYSRWMQQRIILQAVQEEESADHETAAIARR